MMRLGGIEERTCECGKPATVFIGLPYPRGYAFKCATCREQVFAALQRMQPADKSIVLLPVGHEAIPGWITAHKELAA